MSMVSSTSPLMTMMPTMDAASAYRQASVGGVSDAAKVSTDDVKKAQAAAQDFEGLFIGQMLQPMFDTIETDPVFGGGPGEETWKSLLVGEYGKAIAQSGGIGLAPHVMSVMLRAQEASQ